MYSRFSLSFPRPWRVAFTVTAFTFALASVAEPAKAVIRWSGVNLSGAELGAGPTPGHVGS